MRNNGAKILLAPYSPCRLQQPEKRDVPENVGGVEPRPVMVVLLLLLLLLLAKDEKEAIGFPDAVAALKGAVED